MRASDVPRLPALLPARHACVCVRKSLRTPWPDADEARLSTPNPANLCCAREGMTRPEAEQLVVDALSLAMARDSSSGGIIRTVTLDKSGCTVRYIGGSDVPTWFEDLPTPAKSAAAMAVG